MPNGTLQLQDLQVLNNTTVFQFGENDAFAAVDAYFAAHNRLVEEAMGALVQRTTLREVGNGGELQSMHFDALDEYGVPQAQKVVPTPEKYGFPLRRRGAAIQWTRDWFTWHTPAELAAQVTAQADADIMAIYSDLRTALFTATNATFVDVLVDSLSIDVKRLINADSTNIPPDQYGTAIDGATHTHYLGRAGGALAAADIYALIDTVSEHYPEGSILVYINQAQEAAVRAMTGDFFPYADPRLHLPDNTDYATTRTLDLLNTGNRPIGVFGRSEMWVKPWIPANYIFAFNERGPAPVWMREPERGVKGLHLIFDNDAYPLRARAVARDSGFGVRNRLNGAVLYTASGSYSSPSL